MKKGSALTGYDTAKLLAIEAARQSGTRVEPEAYYINQAKRHLPQSIASPAETLSLTFTGSTSAGPSSSMARFLDSHKQAGQGSDRPGQATNVIRIPGDQKGSEIIQDFYKHQMTDEDSKFDWDPGDAAV
ncbi:hypothetical protein E6O75_ATG00278 [Venturia nashicola]|uniref:Uncharacterized protein n=1 Tax=Venturia nashicola TaxID=86259 RepID=A0A4Z1PDD6_9PEZI|nr:hypothetical protein E6O75_ATG00278 [Venturia nashicola]